jgi:NADP-dependent aldehyde dehydrogenase
MTEVRSTSPTTGESVGLGVAESDAATVAVAAAAAAAAAPDVARRSLAWRADLLDAMAACLEEDATDIVGAANAETALGETRLAGELRRSAFQFRFLAGVVRDGAFLEATIDHPTESPMGPLPDLRRQLEPLGPVGVFGASNFPLAFSVPGGDTASALAAGCPVVVKAHPAHPRTSIAAACALARAAEALDAPAGTLALVHGLDAGRALVTDPHIQAVGFTGSYGAGRALFDLASARPVPIPFYGELGSVNPLVVTTRAAEARATEIGEGLVASLTLGAGQFCTKPGLLFVPQGEAGDRLVEAARAALAAGAGATMLTTSIAERFASGVDDLLATAGVDLVARSGRPATAAGAEAVLVTTALASLVGEARRVLETECFGAVAVLVRYGDPSALRAALATLEPALTFSVHAEADDPEGPALLALGRRSFGRVIVNGYPTGVGVAWAMHHGGPLPAATSSLHTSVGASALRRWLRPVCYQSVPDAWLPAALQEANPLEIPRRVDGRLVLGAP